MGTLEEKETFVGAIDTNKDNQITLYELKSGVEKMDSSTQSLLSQELESPESIKSIFSSLEKPLSQVI
jgi:hypothetical protein